MAPDSHTTVESARVTHSNRFCVTNFIDPNSTSTEVTRFGGWSDSTDAPTRGRRCRQNSSTTFNVMRTQNPRSEKLRALAKKFIKDIQVESLQSSWSDGVNALEKDTVQTKQPMWKNHKINSKR